MKCEESIYPLAVNFVDRFLFASCNIRKGQLQLIGVVSLLIASKLRQSNPLDVHDLVYLTENSVMVKDTLVSAVECFGVDSFHGFLLFLLARRGSCCCSRH